MGQNPNFSALCLCLYREYLLAAKPGEVRQEIALFAEKWSHENESKVRKDV